ncbi:adenosylcobinamide-phosphate synthase CbiB [Sphingobium bisphenolivorans]|uniref:adenosylcobinamide-phosphate synthase CbiB n=1 Tax=Sphingobium bisphenolivorans TaxID=1335760 RepID=UPI00039B24F8|nr:adenosylcobinamide-phosphate synthase CbiB [Sphingobium bisphenolivorans]
MAEPVALGALMLDALIGWPGWLHTRTGHPVGAFARIIGVADRRWNRGSPVLRRSAGVGLVLLLLAVAGGAGLLLDRVIRLVAGEWSALWLSVAAWPALAQRSLYDHVRPVAQALRDGNLNEARRAVGWIVGRDTARLDNAGVSRAGIESLAESFCDGVAAPLFWLLLLGLPGAWAYKAINTADSLVGHKEEPYADFGWAPARFDDLLNWVPARIAGVLLCAAGGGGWRVLWRDHGRHASPNAGWPEAAMAGALQVRLAGPVAYDGVMHDKAWIGDGEAPSERTIRAALHVYGRACLLLWACALATWIAAL